MSDLPWFRAFRSRTPDNKSPPGDREAGGCGGDGKSGSVAGGCTLPSVESAVPGVTTTVSQPRHHRHHGNAPPPPPSSSSVPSPSRHNHNHHHLHRPVIHRVSSFLSLIGGGNNNNNNSSNSRPNSPLPTTSSSSQQPDPFLDGNADDGGYSRLRSNSSTLGGQNDGKDESSLFLLSSSARRPQRRGGGGGGGSLDGGDGPWHNPNILQQIEALQTAMLANRDARASIPAKYNSYVLTLLESYANLSHELECAKWDLKELKSLREKELEQFRGISEEWIQREATYKAEIKRVELVLARESGEGLASVALARSGSLVDRSGTKRFQARIRALSKPHDAAETPGQEPLFLYTKNPQAVDVKKETRVFSSFTDAPRIMAIDHDRLLSRKVREREREARRRGSEDKILTQRAFKRRESGQGPKKEHKAQLENDLTPREQKHKQASLATRPSATAAPKKEIISPPKFEQRHSPAEASSPSDSNSSSSSLDTPIPMPTAPQGAQLAVPSSEAPNQAGNSQQMSDRHLRGFSFQQGDEDTLTYPSSPDRRPSDATVVDEAHASDSSSDGLVMADTRSDDGPTQGSDAPSGPGKLPLSSSTGSVVRVGDRGTGPNRDVNSSVDSEPLQTHSSTSSRVTVLRDPSDRTSPGRTSARGSVVLVTVPDEDGEGNGEGAEAVATPL